MKEKQHDIEYFLNKNNLSLKEYNIDSDVELFISEMKQGLASGSSIPMLPTYIEDDKDIPAGEKVLVLDAGGTNFRAAMVSFNEANEADITDFRKRSMPGIEKELSRKDFFGVIADFIADLALETDKIGFCFSYPMVKSADKDGRLIKFSKEIKAPEVEGQLIGAGVLEALNERGITGIKKIVLLNDTVATLLAGKVSGSSNVFQAYIGFILGTGLNASYHEQNKNIIKEKSLPAAGSQLINMETGSCSILKSGRIDDAFRAATANPDAYKLEKMVSGGYLGSLWLTVLNAAGRDGIFSSESAAVLEKAAADSSISVNGSDLSLFLSDGKLPDFLEGVLNPSDIDAVKKISRSIVERAAYLVSVMLLAIIRKSCEEKSSDKPVCICADGTTFWKMHGLKTMVTDNLDRYLAERNISYRITHIDNAPVIGAAVAGLTNG